jgi:hypothetical protein
MRLKFPQSTCFAMEQGREQQAWRTHSLHRPNWRNGLPLSCEFKFVTCQVEPCRDFLFHGPRSGPRLNAAQQRISTARKASLRSDASKSAFDRATVRSTYEIRKRLTPHSIGDASQVD